MSTTLPKIVVITDISDLETSKMISEALGIKFTGDADATDPDYDDTDLHGAANDLQSVHSNRQTNPPTASAEDERVKRDIVIKKYKKDARYVQDVANEVAEAAADVAAGEAVVVRIGFKLKKAGVKGARKFEVFEAGVEWAHVRTKSAGPKVAYVWRYGITPSKGLPPQIEGTRSVINLEADITIKNLTSGKIYGIQYGTIKPGQKKTHSDGEEPVIYGDWIYFVVD